MFDIQEFTADCLAAVRIDVTHRCVHELMRKAFADPSAVMAAVGEPTKAGLVPIHESAELTILHVIWKPGMAVPPHDHRMWSVIGVYSGREDNVFWRRIEDGPAGRIDAAGARTLSTGDVVPLGKDIIHSVTNPIGQLTGAIHVYGGAFFEVARSEWDAELAERPYDVARVRASFSR